MKDNRIYVYNKTNNRYGRLKLGKTFEDYKAKYPEAIKVKKMPSIKTLERYSYDGIAKTPCGCRVEPDGYCEHNLPSWLIIAGII